MTMQWKGVMPAITTAFHPDLTVDHGFLTTHSQWLVEAGCTGIVALGSLGEGATLTYAEKLAILDTFVKAVGGRVPVVASISALSTVEAVEFAQAAYAHGCQGLMVLPPYVYKGDWRENKAHLLAVMQATPLSCMLYNNPVAYGTDFLPAQIQELAAEVPNLGAVKESSTDVRRVSAIRALIGDRLAIFMGVDDAIVEGVNAGAVGWIAGLVNAFPKESVDLFNAALDGDRDRAAALYQWFLPLLRLDTVPKFIQLIKQVQADIGMGSARVRPPRLEIVGDELAATRAVLKAALDNRPQ